MKPENIISALTDVDDQIVRNAKSSRSAKPRRWGKLGAAIAACLCLAALAVGVLPPFGGLAVTAYAYESNLEITHDGIVMDTGHIGDTGEMTGHPLMFYLSGKNIDHVRFSCEKEQLEFIDWTQQREEYGLAQNITVPYGEDAQEYRLLTISWAPAHIIDELTRSSQNTVAALPEERKQDKIVMEITFADGSTATKAITIQLRDDGKFVAAFDDYEISETDTFVQRADAKPLSAGNHERVDAFNDAAKENQDLTADPAAEKAAKAYYDGTVFEVESMKVKTASDKKVVFDVCVSKGGVVQEPDRSIGLEWIDGTWTVVSEGY